ncbi:stress response protein Nst1 [Streptococcus iniae]|uniref:stress response protein Nst1 n=1 Tax=Streptococcus iniae TaxID=1346 RepID=UPI000EF7478E|nr:stress response protein Nst1 [Streptococcus iniae]RLU51863.1 stress response protein Nst1 [Streptococcus iniae]RLU58093.1 stress response protein Nst1 [Streptococcus iniae]RLU60063.1 stress response protein Nst1 [Streptococcus iniae]RLU68342.1 stress response protein Nst1 [Streptococcus iniae]RLU82375.1 stress response protein Nst1 [Streptococcus iniae]
MVTRIDDIGKYYEELSVKAEQSRVEKSEAIEKAMNEEAERQRAKRDTQQSELETLMFKGLQKDKEAKELENQKKQEERIKELEKQWEKQGDYKTDETIKYESALLDLAKSLPTDLDR